MATDEEPTLAEIFLELVKDCRKLWEIEKKLPAFNLQAGEVSEELRAKYTSIFVDDNGVLEAAVEKALILAMCSPDRWRIHRGMNDETVEAIMKPLFDRINKVLDLGEFDTRRASLRVVRKLVDSGDRERWILELQREYDENPAEINAFIEEIGFKDIPKSLRRMSDVPEYNESAADSLELSD